MADEMVLRAQKFINSVYSSRIGMTVEENGRTGWPVMYALTRALQWELGISSLSDSFGPTTLSTLQSKCPKVNASTVPSADFCRIIQSALYCKGYDGGAIDGQYSDRVASSVAQLKQNMGVASVYPGSDLTPKVFKGLLNMDAYVTLNGGTEQVRSIQQWLNGRYVNRRNFFIVPCDGHYSRDVAKAMMYALQYEIGMSDDVANGVFGPGTQAGVKDHTLSVGSNGTWVLLFTAAMIFNQRSGVGFQGTYTGGLADAVRTFQNFVKIPVTGLGDFQTWASLLVSTGDPTRRGTALDCVTTITPARADTLKANGYQIVGRYLTNVPNTTLDKNIKPGELETIAAKGMRVFPIYQTYGGSADYFRPEQGVADCLAAVDAAASYGFRKGTRIYFAVDFDALDYQVTDNILPHFRAIKENMAYLGNRYKIGVYGPRNVCSRVCGAGYADAAFVSDMSTGFSGNLGYPLPELWAFDQIATVSLGSGDGKIEIDNNIASGRDLGQNAFDAVPADQKLDVRFDLAQRDALTNEIRLQMESMGIPESSAWAEFTTTEAVGILMKYDLVFTSLARSLGMRKALIQVPIFWESRHYKLSPNVFNSDIVSDAGVVWYYTASVPDWAKDFANSVQPLEDSSTGLGQIFARTAIRAYNLSNDRGIIDVPYKSTTSKDDVWEVWQKLNQDNVYNISTVPHVHMYHADDIGAGRPSLGMSEAATLDLLIRYQGTLDNADAREGGQKRLSIYRILEKYNAFMRNNA